MGDLVLCRCAAIQEPHHHIDPYTVVPEAVWNAMVEAFHPTTPTTVVRSHPLIISMSAKVK